MRAVHGLDLVLEDHYVYGTQSVLRSSAWAGALPRFSDNGYLGRRYLTSSNAGMPFHAEGRAPSAQGMACHERRAAVSGYYTSVWDSMPRQEHLSGQVPFALTAEGNRQEAPTSAVRAPSLRVASLNPLLACDVRDLQRTQRRFLSCSGHDKGRNDADTDEDQRCGMLSDALDTSGWAFWLGLAADGGRASVHNHSPALPSGRARDRASLGSSLASALAALRFDAGVLGAPATTEDVHEVLSGALWRPQTPARGSLSLPAARRVVRHGNTAAGTPGTVTLGRDMSPPASRVCAAAAAQAAGSSDMGEQPILSCMPAAWQGLAFLYDMDATGSETGVANNYGAELTTALHVLPAINAALDSAPDASEVLADAAAAMFVHSSEASLGVPGGVERELDIVTYGRDGGTAGEGANWSSRVSDGVGGQRSARTYIERMADALVAAVRRARVKMTAALRE